MCFRQKADWDVDQERIQFYDRATHPPGESDFSDFSEAPKNQQNVGTQNRGMKTTWHFPHHCTIFHLGFGRFGNFLCLIFQTGVIVLPTQTIPLYGETPQIDHTFALFDPPIVGNFPWPLSDGCKCLIAYAILLKNRAV